MKRQKVCPQLEQECGKGEERRGNWNMAKKATREREAKAKAKD